MANYANLLATIAANIYTNGNNEVTAAMVKSAVDAMVASLGAGYQFMGVATPSTNPGTPDQKVFYLAFTAGTYANFGNTIIKDGEVGIFAYGSSWSASVVKLTIPNELFQGEASLYNVGPADFTTSGFINKTNGLVNAHAAYYCTDYMPVVPGQVYITNAQQYSLACIGFYDSGKNFVDYVQNPGYATLSFTIPADVVYMRVSAQSVSNKYANLANARYDGLENLTKDTIRLFKGDSYKYIFNASVLTISGYINSSNGSVSTHATYKCSDFLAVLPGQRYLTNMQQLSSACIGYYSSSKEFVDYVQNVDGGGYEFTIPAGVYYMRLSNANGATGFARLENVGYYGTNELTEYVKDLEDYTKPKSAPIRLFPNTPLPCISFEFDDNPETDEKIVSLFRGYGLTCGFAFIASESNILLHGPRYLKYQKQGFDVLSHSVDGKIFNTTNYTYDTALAAVMAAKSRLEDAGIVCNGFVAPSSAMESSFLPILKLAHAYAFTTATTSPSANGRSQDTCQLHRYSMQSNSLADIESFIDACISNDQIITLYGHSYNLVEGGDTSVFSIAKITALIEYCIAKRDSGLLFIAGTDECVKYFFGL